MNRVLAAARLHLMHPLLMLGMPWLIVGISFGINAAIWQLTGVGSAPNAGTGGVLALYVTVLVVFIQAVTQLLPFALGVSLSRRTFYLGTVLTAAVQAVGYGIALSALIALEGATNGWGMNLRFWAPRWVDSDDVVLQIAVSGAPMLAMAAIGVGIGVVFKRWGSSGIWALGIVATLIAGAIAYLLVWLDAWGAIGTWLSGRAIGTLTIALPLALAAVVAGFSWLGLRRVVP